MGKKHLKPRLREKIDSKLGVLTVLKILIRKTRNLNGQIFAMRLLKVVVIDLKTRIPSMSYFQMEKQEILKWIQNQSTTNLSIEDIFFIIS